MIIYRCELGNGTSCVTLPASNVNYTVEMFFDGNKFLRSFFDGIEPDFQNVSADPITTTPASTTTTPTGTTTTTASLNVTTADEFTTSDQFIGNRSFPKKPVRRDQLDPVYKPCTSFDMTAEGVTTCICCEHILQNSSNDTCYLMKESLNWRFRWFPLSCNRGWINDAESDDAATTTACANNAFWSRNHYRFFTFICEECT